MENKIAFTWPIPEGLKPYCNGVEVTDLTSFHGLPKSASLNRTWFPSGKYQAFRNHHYDLYLLPIEGREFPKDYRVKVGDVIVQQREQRRNGSE